MTEKTDLYRCSICGNIVQVLHPGTGAIVCCGQPMTKLVPKTDENGLMEKHIPVYKDNKIIVGSVEHPMTDEHHIDFIQAKSEDESVILTKYLKTTDKPEANFSETGIKTMLEYCNLHGLWIGTKQ